MVDQLENSEMKDDSVLRQSLLDVAVESWRFAKLFLKLMSKLDAGEQNRFQNQYRWYLKRLEESLDAADLRIVNVEGHEFDPGMAATALNLDDFETGDVLVVDQMLEPIVMGATGLAKTGTVMLRKIEK